MDRRSLSLSLVYALILTLVGAIISTTAVLPHAIAGHDNITIDIDDDYSQGETIDIQGTIDDVDDSVDEVTVTVTEPDGTDDSDDVSLDDDEFTFEYDVGNDDGIYTVEVEYDGDNTFSYFLVDDDNDDVTVETNAEIYEQGETVEITGLVEDPQTGEDTVDITVEDPHGDAVVDEETEDVDEDDDDFSHEFDLEEDAPTGRYAVKVTYDGQEAGWVIFEVEESSGSSDEITATLEDATVAPGDDVVITGSIDESDVNSSDDVTLEVTDSDDDVIESDSTSPADDGFFKFEFTLDDEAVTGIYEVVIQYSGYPDKELTFTVSTSGGSSGGGSGSGSGSSGGLTVRLSKTSLLAGETLTVSGVVPQVSGDEPVNISVLRPNGAFVAASFPDPDEDDESYSATIRLPTTLEEDEDYTVVVSYNGREVEVDFDITGQVSGSDGGPLTVRTDKASYASGSTVRITGAVASDSIIEDKQIALQVYNPDEVLYRFDPITPESDGSYSYQMAVGGPLGVTGEWEVKVTYDQLTAETTFDLTGGAPSSPTFNLQVGDLTFPIEYQSDGTVKNMFVRPSDNKLVVSIEAEEDGTLTIELPRQVIDASEGGSDIEYIVAISDFDMGSEEVIEVTESTTTDEARTLVIDYEAGTDLIEIQGTMVVPEFGILAAIILAISLLSVIGFTRFSHRLGNFR